VAVRPLIEQWFPAEIIGAESMRERGAASALPPISFLHVWWARRPLATSRASLVGSLIPAWPTESEAADNFEAAKVREELADEFPGGEEEYHVWFLMVLGIFGDPVAGRARIAAARDTGERLENG
jgi:putative DNA methylase